MSAHQPVTERRQLPEKQEDDIMNWNDVGHGMGFGMGFGWLFGLLILVLLVLAIAALIKYLRK